MMHGINANITTSCSDLNAPPQFDNSSSKLSVNQVSKQMGINNHIPQLHTLNQLRPQQGLLHQPVVQFSGLQLPQQVLQHQFLKTGQSTHVGSVLPTGSYPNIISALQCQFLVQALQQGLISMPPTSQSISAMNCIGATSVAMPSSYRLNTSHSSVAAPDIFKINGNLNPCNKDIFTMSAPKSSQVVAQEPFDHGFVTSEGGSCVAAAANGTLTIVPPVSSFNLSGTSQSMETSNNVSAFAQGSSACNDVLCGSTPLLVSSPKEFAPKQDILEDQNRLIFDKASSPDTSTPNNLLPHEKLEVPCAKAEVLTHIIEGFIIHEGPRPFPIGRSMYINEFLESDNESSMTDEDDVEPMDNNQPVVLKVKNDLKVTGSNETMKQCHCCGIFFLPNTSVSKTGKFCSVSCSKRTAACSRWMIHYASRGLLNDKNKLRKVPGIMSGKKSKNGETDDEFSDENEIKSGKELSNLKRSSMTLKTNVKEQSPECSKTIHNSTSEPLAIRTETPHKSMERDPLDSSTTEKLSDGDASLWGVTEVCDFIQSLSGCGIYAEDFKKQEIDGQALLLLTEEHLMSTMNIKLGPALKICSNIRTLKECTPSCKNASN